MTREIKFRAWDKKEKKWSFGYDYKNLGGFSLVGEVVLMGKLSSVPLLDWNHIEIMQYTGLKDKNGLEIYEGDILLRKHSIKTKSKGVENYDSTHIVEWKTHYAFNYDDSNWVGLELPEYLEEHEVIGNIYQNPELIK